MSKIISSKVRRVKSWKQAASRVLEVAVLHHCNVAGVLTPSGWEFWKRLRNELEIWFVLNDRSDLVSSLVGSDTFGKLHDECLRIHRCTT